jgi:hypothetical protein
VTADPTIILEPGNPYDFQRSELEQLSDIVTRETGVPARPAMREEEGYGVSLHEVLYVWILSEPFRVELEKKLLDLVIDWARDRWRKEKEEHPDAEPRPRSVTILGPDGEPLKALVVRDDSSEPEEDRTEEARVERPRPRPDAWL